MVCLEFFLVADTPPEDVELRKRAIQAAFRKRNFNPDAIPAAESEEVMQHLWWLFGSIGGTRGKWVTNPLSVWIHESS